MQVKSALSYLAETSPDWFELEAFGEYSIIGMARSLKSPWAKEGLRLKITGKQVPIVGEAVPGAVLPARCPERHIQQDKTFCTGIHYLRVDSDEVAIQWWEQLRQFISFQAVASRSQVWPPAHALDHGDAGKHHEKALQIAKKFGLEEEYGRARLGEASWITDPNLRIIDKKGCPINGRAPCPRGCKRKARGRFVTTLRVDCPNRSLIADLVHQERQRRKKLREYWEEMFKSDDQCCLTMRYCPLRDRKMPAELLVKHEGYWPSPKSD